MSANLKLRLIFSGQIGLLAILGWYFRHALNPDAVAYLRIASYFSEGKFDLAVSGYWGPLLALLEHIIDQGFAAPSLRGLLRVVPDVASFAAEVAQR